MTSSDITIKILMLIDLPWKDPSGLDLLEEIEKECIRANIAKWKRLIEICSNTYKEKEIESDLLNQILEDNSANSYELLLIAKLLLNEQSDLDKSLYIVEKSIQCSSRDDAYHNLVVLMAKRLIGTIHIYKGDNKKALTVFNDILSDCPVDLDNKFFAAQIAKVYANKVAVHGELGELEDAEETCKVVIDIFADTAEPIFKEQLAVALINKSYALSKAGYENRAIKVCEEIIDRYENEKDEKIVVAVTRAALNKAAGLVAEGNTTEAYELWKRVSELHIETHNSKLLVMVAEALISIGTFLGKDTDTDINTAISYIDKALSLLSNCKGPRLKSEVARGLVNKAYLLSRANLKDDTLTVLDEFQTIFAPDDVLCPAQYFALTYELRTEIENRPSADNKKAKKLAINATKDFLTSNLKVYLSSVNYHIPKKKKDAYFKKMSITKNRTDSFLFDKSLFKEEISLLLVLRQWNSYTPVIPVEEEADRGGGYYLRHCGEGIVIDPGYDFIDNFYRAGGRFCDIDHIVITHAHDDHTAEFEALIMLLHQYNKEKRGGNKRLSLYLSQGAHRKFSGLLDMRDRRFLRIVSLCPPRLQEQQKILISHSIEMTVLPAYHDDAITTDLSIGLGFIFRGKDWEKTVLFTGDSGLYPRKYGPDFLPEFYNDDRTRPRLDATESQALYKKYPSQFYSPDLLILHIGSIKEYEFEPLESSEKDFDEGKWFYPNHLGILGSLVMLDQLHPSAAIVSEFGSELKDFFIDLVDMLRRALDEKQNSEKHIKDKTWVIPGDLTIAYNIQDSSFLCHDTLEFTAHKYLKCYPGKDCIPEIDHNTEVCEAKFKNNDRLRPYLFTKSPALKEQQRNIAIKEYFRKLYNQKLPYHK